MTRSPIVTKATRYSLRTGLRKHYRNRFEMRVECRGRTIHPISTVGESNSCRFGARAILGVFVTVVMSSCASVPSFNHPLGSPSAKLSPTVADLVQHIQCEILAAKGKLGTDALKNNRYIAFAQLTVDITNFQGSAPQLNYITPYTAPMTNLTYTIGGQLSGTQHRNITQSFTIDITDAQANAAGICSADIKSGRLSGDLGLDAVIGDGLAHVNSSDFGVFPVPQADAAKLSSTVLPVFGSTVDFTIVYGINNVGPTWTLTHFKGPGGGGAGGGGGGAGSGSGGVASGNGSGGGNPQGLLTLTRTVKDTLVISFAPSCIDVAPCTGGAAPAAGALPPFPPSRENALAEEFRAESSATADLLRHNIQDLTSQLEALKVHPGASEAQRTNIEATAVLARSALTLTQALQAFNEQAQLQAQLTEGLRAAATPPQPSATQAAAKAAQDNNTRMILQNLLNSP